MSSKLVANIASGDKLVPARLSLYDLDVAQNSINDGIVGIHVVSDAGISSTVDESLHSAEDLKNTWKSSKKLALKVQQHLMNSSNDQDLDDLEEVPMSIGKDSVISASAESRTRSFEKINFAFSNFWSKQYLNFCAPSSKAWRNTFEARSPQYDSIDLVSRTGLFTRDIILSSSPVHGLTPQSLNVRGPTFSEMMSIAQTAPAVADLACSIIARNSYMGREIPVNISLDIPSYHYYAIIDQKIENGQCTASQGLTWLEAVERRHDQISVVCQTALRHECRLRGEPNPLIKVTPKSGVMMVELKSALANGESPRFDTIIASLLDKDAVFREFYALLRVSELPKTFKDLQYLLYVYCCVAPALRGEYSMEMGDHHDDSMDLQAQLPEQFDGTLSPTKLMYPASYANEVIDNFLLDDLSRGVILDGVNQYVDSAALLPYPTQISFVPTSMDHMQMVGHDTAVLDDAEQMCGGPCDGASAVVMSNAGSNTTFMSINMASGQALITNPRLPTITKEEIDSSNCMLDAEFFAREPCVLDDRISHDAMQDITQEASASCMAGVDVADPPSTDMIVKYVSVSVETALTENASSNCMLDADMQLESSLSDDADSHAVMFCRVDENKANSFTVIDTGLEWLDDVTCPLMSMSIAANSSSNAMLEAEWILEFTLEKNSESALASASCMAGADSEPQPDVAEELALQLSEDASANCMAHTDLPSPSAMTDDFAAQTSEKFSSSCMCDVDMHPVITELDDYASHTIMAFIHEEESSSCMSECLGPYHSEVVDSQYDSLTSTPTIRALSSRTSSCSYSSDGSGDDGWTKLAASRRFKKPSKPVSSGPAKHNALILAVDTIEENKIYARARKLINKIRESDSATTFPTLIEAYLPKAVFVDRNADNGYLYHADPSPERLVLDGPLGGDYAGEMMGKREMEPKDLVGVLYGKEMADNLEKWFAEVGLH